MTDSTNTSSKVEQSDVEGHSVRGKGINDAEAPSEDRDVAVDETREADAPDVEGHAKRFFR